MAAGQRVPPETAVPPFWKGEAAADQSESGVFSNNRGSSFPFGISLLKKRTIDKREHFA